MADTLEYADVAFPKERFTPELIAELYRLAPSMIEQEGDSLIVKHLYIERRMIPLNMNIDNAKEEQLAHAVREYGDAIRQLAAANIFPGDMLFKNFGVTRFGRVVFYDYDEIAYMTDCNFRRMPAARTPEDELSAEPWYPVGPADVFPEEFAAFLLGDERVREVFLEHHRELLDAQFWTQTQSRIAAGHVEDIFPYPEALRFRNRFARGRPH
jgi:isocitrate dehydrogenase kinase/phosphatase